MYECTNPACRRPTDGDYCSIKCEVAVEPNNCGHQLVGVCDECADARALIAECEDEREECVSWVCFCDEHKGVV